MTKETFAAGIKGFDHGEAMRGKLFPMAANLFHNDHRVEAAILILSTWNVNRFRMHLHDFDIKIFERKLNKVISNLEPLKAESLQGIDLRSKGEVISSAFNTFQQIPGVEATGGTKVLHLINPDLFVMWDSYIRGEKTFWHYKKAVIAELRPKRKQYAHTGADYVHFLLDCKKLLPFVVSGNSKTPAKQIDEVNYFYITLKVQELEKQLKTMSKAERRDMYESVKRS